MSKNYTYFYEHIDHSYFQLIPWVKWIEFALLEIKFDQLLHTIVGHFWTKCCMEWKEAIKYAVNFFVGKCWCQIFFPFKHASWKNKVVETYSTNNEPRFESFIKVLYIFQMHVEHLSSLIIFQILNNKRFHVTSISLNI